MLVSCRHVGYKIAAAVYMLDGWYQLPLYRLCFAINFMIFVLSIENIFAQTAFIRAASNRLRHSKSANIYDVHIHIQCENTMPSINWKHIATSIVLRRRSFTIRPVKQYQTMPCQCADEVSFTNEAHNGLECVFDEWKLNSMAFFVRMPCSKYVCLLLIITLLYYTKQISEKKTIRFFSFVVYFQLFVLPAVYVQGVCFDSHYFSPSYHISSSLF